MGSIEIWGQTTESPSSDVLLNTAVSQLDPTLSSLKFERLFRNNDPRTHDNAAGVVVLFYCIL